MKSRLPYYVIAQHSAKKIVIPRRNPTSSRALKDSTQYRNSVIFLTKI